MKGLEALERITDLANDCHSSLEFQEDYDTVKKELKDYEWLLSIINTTFIGSLDREDGFRLYEIIKERVE